MVQDEHRMLAKDTPLNQELKVNKHYSIHNECMTSIPRASEAICITIKRL